MILRVLGAALACLLISSALKLPVPFGVVGPIADPEPTVIPPPARVIAAAELAMLTQAPTPPVFGLHDPSPLRNAYLGDPFVLRWASDTFRNFEKAPAEDILLYLDNFCICFPVEDGKRTFGSINVMLDHDGTWTYAGRSVGDAMTSKIKRVRGVVSHAQRPYVTMVITGFGGTFITVGNGFKVSEIVAIDQTATDTTSMPLMDKEVVLVPVARAAPPLQEAIRKHNERRISAKPFSTEDLRKWDDEQ